MQASQRFYDILSSYTLAIQAVSCDEVCVGNAVFLYFQAYMDLSAHPRIPADASEEMRLEASTSISIDCLRPYPYICVTHTTT